MTNKLNKGEWSEFYAFIKVLSDRKLNASDSNLNPIKDKYYPVRKILRGQGKGKTTYDLKDARNIKVIFANKTEHPVEIPYGDISTSVKPIFEAISNGKGSFSINLAEQLIAVLSTKNLKASSSKKGDLNIVIHDHITNLENSVDFSIKSYVGGKPTLLNASTATNFVFTLKNFENKLFCVNDFSGRSKLQRRVKHLQENGVEFKFSNMSSGIFARNLMKIDSLMPQFLSSYLLLFFSGEGTSFSDLTHSIVAKGLALDGLGNPYNFEDLKYKIKQLLLNVALGMVPNTNWDGFIKADGGYIVVKDSGEIVCFHIYNISELGEYLFNSTRLESASSTRHDYASVYLDGGVAKMKLNLQIRFS